VVALSSVGATIAARDFLIGVDGPRSTRHHPGMRRDGSRRLVRLPGRAAAVAIAMALVGCASDGPNFSAATTDTPVESSEKPGSWSVELRDEDGAPFAGSETVIVHFDEADFDCDSTEPDELEEGTVLEVERDEDIFMVSDPPQTEAVAVVCES
jgi:hypothetical protein